MDFIWNITKTIISLAFFGAVASVAMYFLTDPLKEVRSGRITGIGSKPQALSFVGFGIALSIFALHRFVRWAELPEAWHTKTVFLGYVLFGLILLILSMRFSPSTDVPVASPRKSRREQ